MILESFKAMIHPFIWESNIIKRLLNNAKRYKMWSKRSFFLTIDGHPCPLPHMQPFLSYLCVHPSWNFLCTRMYMCPFKPCLPFPSIYRLSNSFLTASCYFVVWLFIILLCVLPFPSILPIPNGYLCASFFMPQTLF